MWTLIDNEFVDQVAHLAGLPRDEVARHEERAPGVLERLARTLAVASPEMFITGETQVPVETEEELVTQMTERVITEAASEGRVVLVGRGAQAILATRRNALHVYVVASKPFRRKVAIERLGVDGVETCYVFVSSGTVSPATITASMTTAPPPASVSGTPMCSAMTPNRNAPNGAIPTNTNE